MIEWSVTSQEEGQCALEILGARLPDAPRGYLRQLLRKGRVTRGGTPLDEEAPLREGDTLRLPESRRLADLLEMARRTEVNILLETEEFLVAAKPSGLAVHAGEGHREDNLTDRVRLLMQKRKAPYSVAPVHRLDVETSGPVLFAKGRRSAAALGRLFMDRTVTKRYVALVAGRCPEHLELTGPLTQRGQMREASTEVRTLAGDDRFSLVALDLHSGRTHQIRRHLAETGHPLVGDSRYGGPPLPGSSGMFLHCHFLGFPAPDGKEDVCIRLPLPEAFASALRALGPPFADGEALLPGQPGRACP